MATIPGFKISDKTDAHTALAFTDSLQFILADQANGLNYSITQGNLMRYLVAAESKTISGGAITITSTHQFVLVTLDTEGGAAADDLDNITAGCTNQVLIIQCASGARVPTLRDGVGNIRMAGNFALDHVSDKIILISISTNFDELTRSNNT